MKHYIINPSNHFFVVKAPVDVDALRAGGCEVHNNLGLLYESVVATTGQELDEIDGGEFVIDRGPDNRLRCVDARGVVDHIEDSNEFQRGGLEEYINDYQI